MRAEPRDRGEDVPSAELPPDDSPFFLIDDSEQPQGGPCGNRFTFARWVFGMGQSPEGAQADLARRCERIARDREGAHACESKDCAEAGRDCEYDYGYIPLRVDGARMRTKKGREFEFLVARGILFTGCFCTPKGQQF